VGKMKLDEVSTLLNSEFPHVFIGVDITPNGSGILPAMDYNLKCTLYTAYQRQINFQLVLKNGEISDAEMQNLIMLLQKMTEKERIYHANLLKTSKKTIYPEKKEVEKNDKKLKNRLKTLFRL
jgi:hypothetical protein